MFAAMVGDEYGDRPGEHDCICWPGESCHVCRPVMVEKLEAEAFPGAGVGRPPQPATGYQKNVTPRGPVVRPEDAFPESCCEGAPPAQDDNETGESG